VTSTLVCPQRIKKVGNILQALKRTSCNRLGHFLCRNCLLKHVIEDKIEGRIKVMGRWRKHKQLMNDIKEERGYWKLKEESLDCTVWRTCFRRGCGPVKRLLNEWITCGSSVIYVCVIMKILLQIYLILDAFHILCSDIQSVIVQMCLLYWTELIPFSTWVLQLSVSLLEYPCGVSVLTVPYFSVQLSNCWHQTLSHNANL
jgi:hypothetical protein